jgi:hypothetical protein
MIGYYYFDFKYFNNPHLREVRYMVKKKKVTRKRVVPKKTKKVYYCVPCGMEVAITKAGIGTSTLMCCGEVMKPKKK